MKSPGPRRRAAAVVTVRPDGDAFWVELDGLAVGLWSNSKTAEEHRAAFVAALTRYGRACRRAGLRTAVKELFRLRNDALAEDRYSESNGYDRSMRVVEAMATPKKKRSG